MIACSHGHADIVEFLADKGALQNRGGYCPDDDDWHYNDKGYGVLHLAIEGEHFAVVQMLVDKYAQNVNEETYEGVTPLMVAAIHGNLEIIRFLLSKGANKNVVTSDSSWSEITKSAYSLALANLDRA